MNYKWKVLLGVLLFFSLCTKQTTAFGYPRTIKIWPLNIAKGFRNKLLVNMGSRLEHSAIQPAVFNSRGITRSLIPNKDRSAILPEVYYNLAISLLLLGVLVLGGLFYRSGERSRSEIGGLRTKIMEMKTCLNLAEERQDWLIKEVHHRVKNNLQIIMSLLNTQASFLSNEEAIKAFRNCQHRLFAITLVHQKLYQTANLSSIDMVAYTRELLEYLQDEYDDDTKLISFKVDMVPLALNVEMAVPFGLIINEAISNALKFAFPATSEGQIDITLQSCNQYDYDFLIGDNGIGLAQDEAKTPVNSFGNTLITGLARQLGGRCQVENAGGVKIRLQFSKKQEPETLAV